MYLGDSTGWNSGTQQLPVRWHVRSWYSDLLKVSHWEHEKRAQTSDSPSCRHGVFCCRHSPELSNITVLRTASSKKTLANACAPIRKNLLYFLGWLWCHQNNALGWRVVCCVLCVGRGEVSCDRGLWACELTPSQPARNKPSSKKTDGSYSKLQKH